MRKSARSAKGIRALLLALVLGILFSQAAMPAAALWTPPTAPDCNAAYLVNADTGTVIYEKNADEKIYPASTTKLMTAILAYEKFKNALNTTVTVQYADIRPLEGKYGSLVPLKVGEKLTVEQLLYCLLLPSGDDAADVLARATSGSIDAFVDQMNEKAKEIGAKNTHYANPHGLQDPDHTTTAYDTYLVAKYAMQYDLLARIVDTAEYSLPATNLSKARTLLNTNWMLLKERHASYYAYAKGIKTGSTTPAGACLVSYAQKDGITYYCVVMGGKKGTDSSGNVFNTAFSSTKALYQWVYGNFSVQSLVRTTDTATQVKVELSPTGTLSLIPAGPLNALLPNSFKKSDLKITLSGVPASVRAPVSKGQKIGRETVYYVNPQTKAQEKLGTVDLVAADSASRSQALYLLFLAQSFFRSVWFKVVAVLLILLLALYIALSVLINRRKRRRLRRRRRY